MDVQSVANRSPDLRVLRQAVRGISRVVFPDQGRRARVHSALATTAGAIRRLLRRARASCRLEIDQTRLIEEMPLLALLSGKREGFAVAAPAIVVSPQLLAPNFRTKPELHPPGDPPTSRCCP